MNEAVIRSVLGRLVIFEKPIHVSEPMGSIDESETIRGSVMDETGSLGGFVGGDSISGSFDDSEGISGSVGE